ncbi:MAG: Na(+)-translocating NADH-quinone reductase subunit A [Bacteroidaceae bacterium]|nr:Na(+)-translocating NADH-quinone reductase subunit A [Bacteroidaceae bacterium]
MGQYKIRKGLDLNLAGEAPLQVKEAPLAAEYAISPADFLGVMPKLVVKEGENVLAGSPLFVDKATESIAFVSPVSGTVKAIERGERRKILYIRITPDAAQVAKEFNVTDVTKATREEVLNLLLQSGLFAFMRQRPYDVIANAQDTPKAIFVSAFSKMPLAADFTFVAKGQEEDFRLGIATLSKLAQVHVGVSPEQINTSILPLENVDVNVFDGPNPAGNVGVQINHVSPVNKGEVVWTMGAEAVIFVGRLMRTGKVDLTRTIAVAGSKVAEPTYLKVKVGASISSILSVTEEHVRIIDGNPLVGKKVTSADFLSAHATEVCAIPEGDDVNELFGWIKPRFNQFSTSPSYLSWLMGNKKYDLDCRVKGGERHMIMSAEYERVFPMDIYPSYLVKAIVAGDIDRQEALGIYEVAPEDFAVAEFIDSSKLELQRIVREALDILRKENS